MLKGTVSSNYTNTNVVYFVFLVFFFSNTGFNFQNILSLLQERKFPQCIVPNTSNQRKWAAEVFPEAYKSSSVWRCHKCCSLVCQQNFSPTEPPLLYYQGQNVGHTDQPIYAVFLFCFVFKCQGSILFCFLCGKRTLLSIMISPFSGFWRWCKESITQINQGTKPKKMDMVQCKTTHTKKIEILKLDTEADAVVTAGQHDGEGPRSLFIPPS